MSVAEINLGGLSLKEASAIGSAGFMKNNSMRTIIAHVLNTARETHHGRDQQVDYDLGN